MKKNIHFHVGHSASMAGYSYVYKLCEPGRSKTMMTGILKDVLPGFNDDPDKVTSKRCKDRLIERMLYNL